MSDLRLAVKRKWFEQTKAGLKPFEYRLDNEYWRKRLIGKNYNNLIITLGYPKKTETDKIIVMPYLGYEMQTITHAEFCEKPERVFAIRQELNDDL